MTSTWKVRAFKASRPENPDPIEMHAGDLIELAGNEDDGWIWCRHPTGKESWVPMSYLSTAAEGDTRTALVDYDATELPVEVGKCSRPNGKRAAGCGVKIRRGNGDGSAWHRLSVSTRHDQRERSHSVWEEADFERDLLVWLFLKTSFSESKCPMLVRRALRFIPTDLYHLVAQFVGSTK